MPTRTCPGCGLRLAIAARAEQQPIDCPRCRASLGPGGEGPPKPAPAAPWQERPWAWPRPGVPAKQPRGRKWRLAISFGLLGLLLAVTDIPPRGPGRRPPTLPPPGPSPIRPGALPCAASNPYPVGTQLRLEPAGEYPVPCQPEQLVYSARHLSLFVRGTDHTIHVLDLGEGKWRRGERLAGQCLTDMSLAPDESALFVADHGQEGPGRKSRGQHRVHRFDLGARRWNTRDTPEEAARIEAVDGFHFVLSGEYGWANLTFNRWERDAGRITACDRRSCSRGTIAYDPWTRRLYHAFRKQKLLRLTVYRLEDQELVEERSRVIEGPGAAAANPNKAVLSVDGRWLYLGRVQLDMQEKDQPRIFPKNIFAASRDLAFWRTIAFDAHSGNPVRDKPRRSEVYTVSRDGLWLWGFDLGRKVVFRTALRGEKAER
jgi:hypothetical protein